ncbi:MAG: DNA polymerase III subunit delta [Gammaproteobacteria bacterium]|nr:DNA polymerase III subunit delta [Gammaproteobacteria bacterium]NNF62027.1 DNA polymerase III subunit delta [Gammaproteobacteria bacterium]NNM19895.1 DNA polymerase III subunit delta [Gammaproteobacteria bacterium]
MKTGPEKLKSQLEKKLAPFYLIAGDQPLLVTEAADLVRSHAREAGYGARELHVVERGFDWAALQAETRNMSLFAEKRLIELRIPTAKPGTDGSKALVQLAEDPSPDVLILVITGRLDARASSAKWVKSLARAGVHVPVTDIPTGRLPQWVQRRMRDRGLQAPIGGARIIAERCEGNLLAADQEIEKLLLINGPGKVDETAVMQSVTDSARFDVFQLADAAMVGDTTRALRILNGLLAEGVAAPLILWALDRELRTLARLSWLLDHGVSIGDAMAQARVWSSRRTLVRRALDRHRKPGAFIRLLGIAARADRIAKGVEFGDAAAELTRLVAALAGTPLPDPLAEVA